MTPSAGIIHNRHRDWDGEGNHPGYALATWLTTDADQVWLCTRALDSVWTNHTSERGVKPAKRHQAVSVTGKPTRPWPDGAASTPT